jgi:hypothetical protein
MHVYEHPPCDVEGAQITGLSQVDEVMASRHEGNVNKRRSDGVASSCMIPRRRCLYSDAVFRTTIEAERYGSSGERLDELVPRNNDILL